MFRHQFITNPSINLAPLIHDANIGLFKVIINDLNRDKAQSLFTKSCKNGALLIAKELLKSNFDIDIHENNECAFRFACYEGHLKVAKWLLQLDGKIDIHALNEDAFRNAGGDGHLEVAKWLLQLNQNVAGATSLRSAHDVRTSGISFYKFIGTGERSELSVARLR